MASNIRGIRNNNPFNIVKGIAWKGLSPSQSDSRFCQFQSLSFGIRAGIIILRNYISGHNSARLPFNTIEKIINRFAPPSENQTTLYIRLVSEKTSIPSTQVIRPDDEDTICRIAQAICSVEVGVIFPLDLFHSAYKLI